MKKLLAIIAIACSFANADFLEHTNRNLCEIKELELSVAVHCTYRENTDNAESSTFVISKDTKYCSEQLKYNDGTSKSITNITRKNITYVTTTIFDEFNVKLSNTDKKSIVNNCMSRYAEYKAAAKRW